VVDLVGACHRGDRSPEIGQNASHANVEGLARYFLETECLLDGFLEVVNVCSMDS
jgi:hypothetical protein